MRKMANLVCCRLLNREKRLKNDLDGGALGRRFCREAYEDVLRAAKLDPRKVENQSLYEEDGELSVLLPLE